MARAWYALKLRLDNDCYVITYFGGGTSSEGDVQLYLHSGLFLDTVLPHQRLRNLNVDELASKALGYGITVLRVDGIDIFAVYIAIKVARKYVVKNN